ncbi:MAG: 50S ribosomal protein L39e [Candidatus Bathyarchaeota archaeon]|nr:MAG: 50S ribosomal protein L39e [Candidatus Bathyarchaeota archaeon]
MAKHKPASRKMHLVKANKRSRSVPTWVIVKTRGRVRVNVKRRHWRRQKLKI